MRRRGPWHPRRRGRFWVRWGANSTLNFPWNPREQSGAHLTNHSGGLCAVLHPSLRLPENHDDLYDTLGHEFTHHVLGTDETLAYKLERRMGQALHDLLVNFHPPACGCPGVPVSRAS